MGRLSRSVEPCVKANMKLGNLWIYMRPLQISTREPGQHAKANMKMEFIGFYEAIASKHPFTVLSTDIFPLS